jgi:hypothetical protein
MKVAHGQLKTKLDAERKNKAERKKPKKNDA